MAPQSKENYHPTMDEKISTESSKQPIVWRNICIFVFFHMTAIYGLVLLTTAKLATLIFGIVLYQLSLLGVLAGAHRLWSHRSYSAKWPVRLFLMLCETIAFQGTAIDWARDHRVHHKYTETDADPYNAARGFFYCHMGWLLVRKHPEVTKKGKTIDFSDLYADPILRFQEKYYFIVLVPIMFCMMPVLVPWYFWNESLQIAFFTCVSFRFCFGLHSTWLINSVAHMWGFHPYDKNIYAAENKMVSFFTLGEGWHNYHHTFPWDYKASEFGNYSLNLSTVFIDICYKLGLVYNLKTVNENVIKQRVLRTGDGTHNVWGLNDPDQTKLET